MRKEVKVLPPEVLLEEYRQLLQERPDVVLPLVVTGNSMSPFLIGGRDKVFLARLDRPARRGDILLYRRNNGQYVLHRVYRTGTEGMTMVGDAQQELEPGIRQEQILAVVTRAERKGKPMAPGSFCWGFFEKVWIQLVPTRPFLRRVYSWFR